MTEQREVQRTSFGAVAASYERGRPGYPRAAIELVRDELTLGAGSKVLDLAAGTGKLTRSLVHLGAELVAVEPLEGMRTEFATALPAVTLLDGNAESIPLADSSVDAVVVGQAFHWFDAAIALAEIDRVLRPGGGLALLWNEADETDADVKRLYTAMRTVGNRPDTIETEWRRVIDSSGRFEPARRARFRWSEPMSHDDVLASVASRSYVAVLEPAAKADFFVMIGAIVEQLPEPFELRYLTEVFWCRKPAPPTGS